MSTSLRVYLVYYSNFNMLAFYEDHTSYGVVTILEPYYRGINNFIADDLSTFSTVKGVEILGEL